MSFSVGSPLHGDRRRAGSFGDDAEEYDRIRPPYPPEMVDALVADRPEAVLDVGCGTGIAARLFSARGCRVLGLEPDPRMASVARRHGVIVEDGTFEEWDAGDRTFDLLIAGQAWHWVDPHLGAHRAADVLRPGGCIGLFWNQAFPDHDVGQAMDAVYARVAPALGEHSVLIGRRDGWLYESIAGAVKGTGRFSDVALGLFEHDVVYSTDDWLSLAATHSDHRTLPPAELQPLLNTLRAAIDGAGGEVPVRYETTLVTGRSIAG
jgi:SAM-dependent methyltransferase